MSSLESRSPAVTAAARRALLDRFSEAYGRETDDAGYVRWPQDNLLPGVSLDQFENDLRRGDGNELRAKFCAVHSSAALAVNTFARFKDHPADLIILGQAWPTPPRFEEQLPLVPHRRPANIDVWLEHESRVLAVESKFLEYLTPKQHTLAKPAFAPAYDDLAREVLDPWRELFEEVKTDSSSHHLDRAQLLKHLLGLRTWSLAQPARGRADLTLLYLFWEPTNWHDVPACVRHRKEAAAFAASLRESPISFAWRTYEDLWREWESTPTLVEHTTNLRARYEVGIFRPRED
jgi:hypothetical protein